MEFDLGYEGFFKGKKNMGVKRSAKKTPEPMPEIFPESMVTASEFFFEPHCERPKTNNVKPQNSKTRFFMQWNCYLLKRALSITKLLSSQSKQLIMNYL